jgi:hypothetical protein
MPDVFFVLTIGNRPHCNFVFAGLSAWKMLAFYSHNRAAKAADVATQ